jgi:putative NADH-flavin reductase
VKIFIIGATGRTGQALTAAALANGHSVTAFGRRSPQNPPEGLRLATGDPRQTSDLAATMSGHDAVVSCLGHRSSSDAGLLAGSVSAALSALQSVNIRRFVVVSQGLLFPSANPVILLLRLLLRTQVADSQAMESILRKSLLDWTIIRPPRLTGGTHLRGFRVAISAQPSGRWSMAYSDLGACLLTIVEQQRHVREVVGVTSA